MGFELFHIDELSLVMLTIISIVGVTVTAFSARYLQGDSFSVPFFFYLVSLLITLGVLCISDHFILFLGSWVLSNALLVRLMIYKANWQASLNSGLLAAKYFIAGFLMMFTAMLLLKYQVHSWSILKIIHSSSTGYLTMLALGLIFIAAMIQSALWPFHRWLTSSLNSPTPVSALMHAGLVNGGGFLLIKFSPLFILYPHFLEIVFILGLFTALIATIWKLIQSDVKRMLACSTMAQMGFMIMQCGLGLYPAALAHLCFHGLFKAYLFLASGSAAEEKRVVLNNRPIIVNLLVSAVCAVLGAFAFVYTSHKNIFILDTNLVLIFIAFIMSMQFSLTMLVNSPLKGFPIALISTIAIGSFYGFCVYSIELFLAPLHLMHPQPLKLLHIIAIFTLLIAWLIITLSNYLEKSLEKYPFLQKYYVLMLNLSQPDSKTVTTHRNSYRYQ